MLHKFPFVTLMSYMQRIKLSLNIVQKISCRMCACCILCKVPYANLLNLQFRIIKHDASRNRDIAVSMALRNLESLEFLQHQQRVKLLSRLNGIKKYYYYVQYFLPIVQIVYLFAIILISHTRQL